jgi:hypothetical protein
LRAQEARLDVGRVLCIVGIRRVDGGVADRQPAAFEQVFKLLQPMVVFMDVTDEHVLDFVGHRKFSSNQGLLALRGARLRRQSTSLG